MLENNPQSLVSVASTVSELGIKRPTNLQGNGGGSAALRLSGTAAAITPTSRVEPNCRPLCHAEWALRETKTAESGGKTGSESAACLLATRVF